MTKINISAITLAISLVYSVNAMAQNMSKTEYKSITQTIESEYKTAKHNCNVYADNAKDICVVDAKGKKNVAQAELDASYKPSKQAHYDAIVIKAKADYAVAIERCDDKAGNIKDVCVKEAKAALISTKSDAKAQLTSAEAVIPPLITAVKSRG